MAATTVSIDYAGKHGVLSSESALALRRCARVTNRVTTDEGRGPSAPFFLAHSAQSRVERKTIGGVHALTANLAECNLRVERAQKRGDS